MFASFLLLIHIDFDKTESSVLHSAYLRIKTKVATLISIRYINSSTLQLSLRMRKIHLLSFSNSEYAVALKYKHSDTIITSCSEVILVFNTIRSTNFTAALFV